MINRKSIQFSYIERIIQRFQQSLEQSDSFFYSPICHFANYTAANLIGDQLNDANTKINWVFSRQKMNSTSESNSNNNLFFANHVAGILWHSVSVINVCQTIDLSRAITDIYYSQTHKGCFVSLFLSLTHSHPCFV